MYAEVQMPRPAKGFGSLNLDCVFFKHQLLLKSNIWLLGKHWEVGCLRPMEMDARPGRSCNTASLIHVIPR
jgi:hypothetical protein